MENLKNFVKKIVQLGTYQIQWVIYVIGLEFGEEEEEDSGNLVTCPGYKIQENVWDQDKKDKSESDGERVVKGERKVSWVE